MMLLIARAKNIPTRPIRGSQGSIFGTASGESNGVIFNLTDRITRLHCMTTGIAVAVSIGMLCRSADR